jgi:Uma2 family endonuclease
MIDPNVIESGSPIWVLAELFPPQGSWGTEEYLQLEAGRLIEFESGSLEIHDMPTPEHQKLVLAVYRWLFAWTQPLPDPGDVYVAPLPIRLWAEKYREPDVVWICSARTRIDEYPDGADLVVEVTSPGQAARKRDLVVKASEYAKAAINEYWIVDSQQRQVHVGKLDGGKYSFTIYNTDQTAVSASHPNLRLPLPELFK